MAETTFASRLILDRRTHQEWMEADPIAKFGEMMVVEVPADSSQVEQEPCFLLKVGDGVKPYSQLNWFSGLAADVYDWAKAATKPTYTASEIQSLETYLQTYLSTHDVTMNTFPSVPGSAVPTDDRELVNKGYVDDQIEQIELTPGPQGDKGDKGEKGDTGAQGPKGDPGGYFTPAVDGSGNLTWTASDVSMGTIPSANIKGPQGEKGDQGDAGVNGGYYKPTVDASGNLTWAGSVAGMPSVSGANIKGPQGDIGPQGEQGEQGPQGAAGTSAYQAAQTGGFVGTESDFNTALGKIGSATAVNTLAFGPRTVATSAWAADTTQPDYGFRASIPLTGVTENHSPDVRLSIADATSGILSPVAASYNGGVYIYASEQPSATVNIESIICTLVTE